MPDIDLNSKATLFIAPSMETVANTRHSTRHFEKASDAVRHFVEKLESDIQWGSYILTTAGEFRPEAIMAAYEQLPK